MRADGDVKVNWPSVLTVALKVTASICALVRADEAGVDEVARNRAVSEAEAADGLIRRKPTLRNHWNSLLDHVRVLRRGKKQLSG
jgi:hypothetical protein